MDRMELNTPKVARAVLPNAGETARYNRQMIALIDEMSASVVYWITAAYRKAPPLLAQDASPVRDMKKQLRELAARWQKRFDDAAPIIAESYARRTFKAADSAMRIALRDAGMSVKFTLTPAMRDALDATITENIGLIKSIPADYLQQVQGSVLRGFTAGRDLEKIVSDVKKLYPAASNRAVLIARDQSNKATAVVTRTRQLELGITEAVWMHSHAGKTPRPDHVAANGKRYEVAKGMKISGEYIFPGQEINCRCTSRSVLPGF